MQGPQPENSPPPPAWHRHSCRPDPPGCQPGPEPHLGLTTRPAPIGTYRSFLGFLPSFQKDLTYELPQSIIQIKQSNYGLQGG
jgi:hypothetical protein